MLAMYRVNKKTKRKSRDKRKRDIERSSSLESKNFICRSELYKQSEPAPICRLSNNNEKENNKTELYFNSENQVRNEVESSKVDRDVLVVVAVDNDVVVADAADAVVAAVDSMIMNDENPVWMKMVYKPKT